MKLGIQNKGLSLMKMNNKSNSLTYWLVIYLNVIKR